MGLPPLRGSLLERMTEAQRRERLDQALDRLRSRGALQDRACPSCRTENWNVDFLAVPSTPPPGLSSGSHRDLSADSNAFSSPG